MRPISSPSSELLQRLALAAAVFALAFALSALRIGHGAPDFYVFWTAAQHPGAPYDPAIVAELERRIHLGGVWPFVYPPSFLDVVWPFAQLPLTLAYPLWAGLETSLFVLAASALVRPAWAAALLVAAPAVFASADLGQTSLVTGAAMLAAWTWRDSRPALAGALLGLAAAVKPQALLLAPLVFWGRWKLLGWMALAGAAAVLASLGFGWRRWIEWTQALARFQGLIAATDRISPSALLPGPLWAGLVGALGAWLAASRRDLAGLIAGGLCVTPYAHAYDLAALTPLGAAWLIGWREQGWARAGIGGALLAGVIATPLAALGACLALAALPLAARRAPQSAAISPAPAAR